VPIVNAPNLFLKLLKRVNPSEYDKLFGSLSIETNFPYEELINKYTVEQVSRKWWIGIGQ